MAKTKWILLIIFLAGVLILVLPDEGKPMISFNKMHGPSLQDMAGLVLIAISWLAGIVMIAGNRKRIITRIGVRNIFLLIFIYLLSCFGVVMALKFEIDWLLWPCVITASFINILFVIYAFSKK